MKRVRIRIGVPTKILEALRAQTKGMAGERGNGTALTGTLEEMLRKGVKRKALNLPLGELSTFGLLVDDDMYESLKYRASSSMVSLKQLSASIIATLFAEQS